MSRQGAAGPIGGSLQPLPVAELSRGRCSRSKARAAIERADRAFSRALSGLRGAEGRAAVHAPSCVEAMAVHAADRPPQRLPRLPRRGRPGKPYYRRSVATSSAATCRRRYSLFLFLLFPCNRTHKREPRSGGVGQLQWQWQRCGR